MHFYHVILSFKAIGYAKGMLKYARHVPRSEEIVMAPATAQLVQLTISSELARRQNIPVPDMLPAAEVDFNDVMLTNITSFT